MLRLKAEKLYQKAKAEGSIRSIRQLSLRGKGTYTTAFRYVHSGSELDQINLTSLSWFLVDGLGISPENLLEMKFGDIFAWEPKSAPAEPED